MCIAGASLDPWSCWSLVELLSTHQISLGTYWWHCSAKVSSVVFMVQVLVFSTRTSSQIEPHKFFFCNSLLGQWVLPGMWQIHSWTYFLILIQMSWWLLSFLLIDFNFTSYSLFCKLVFLYWNPASSSQCMSYHPAPSEWLILDTRNRVKASCWLFGVSPDKLFPTRRGVPFTRRAAAACGKYFSSEGLGHLASSLALALSKAAPQSSLIPSDLICSLDSRSQPFLL